MRDGGEDKMVIGTYKEQQEERQREREERGRIPNTFAFKEFLRENGAITYQPISTKQTGLALITKSTATAIY